MTPQTDGSAEEIKRLRRCINDLVSIVALPAVWTGGAPSQIVGNLLDALVSMLNLAFVYARLRSSNGSEPAEMMRIGSVWEPRPQPQQISERLRPWLTENPQQISPVIRNFFDGHDIDHGVAAKSSKMIGADHRVVVVFPDVIYPRFELNQIVDMGAAFRGPIHPTNDAAEWDASGSVATGDLFERLEHPILIESSLAEVCFTVGSKLELASALPCRRVNPCRNQPLQVLVSLVRVNNVHGLVTAFKSILNKGEQDAILFLVTVKKRAHMARLCEVRTSEMNWGRGLHRAASYLRSTSQRRATTLPR